MFGRASEKKTPSLSLRLRFGKPAFWCAYGACLVRYGACLVRLWCVMVQLWCVPSAFPRNRNND
jgi:hypothetical protein